MALPRVTVLRTMMFFKWPWIWPLLRFLEAPFNHVSLHLYFCFRQPAHLGFSNSNSIECLGKQSSEGLCRHWSLEGLTIPLKCVSAQNYSSKLGRVFVSGWVHDSNSGVWVWLKLIGTQAHPCENAVLCGEVLLIFPHWHIETSFFKEKNTVSDKFFKGVPKSLQLHTHSPEVEVFSTKKEVFF